MSVESLYADQLHVCVSRPHEGRPAPLEVTQPIAPRLRSGCFAEWVALAGNITEALCLLCPPGRIRTRRQSSGSATNVASTPDSRGRSRAKVVSQSQRKKCILCCLLP